MGDAVDVCSGKDYKHLDEGVIPVYGTGGYMLSVSEALSLHDAIGIGRKGTIDNPYILRAPFWTVDTLFYCVPKNSDLNFVCALYQTINWRSMDESTGVPSLSKTAINDVDIHIPSVDEQHCIGELFSNLDETITLHQCKCFQDHTGVFGAQIGSDSAYYTATWEQRKFEDIAQRQSESSISDDENPCIEYEDIVSEAGTLNKNVYEKQSRKKGIKFTSNDVLYGKLRPYLHNWLNPDFSGVAVGDWWILRPVSVDKNFLFRLIQTSQYDAAANQSSGTKMPRADWKHVSSVEFMIPTSIEEQSQIAAVFDNLDNLITLHQCKCFQDHTGVFGAQIGSDSAYYTATWEQRKFKDLFRERREKTTVEDEDILLSCAITGIYLNSELFGHQRGRSNIGYLKIKMNDLILSAQNLHLGNANVNKRFEHGIISPAYKVYEITDCNPDFIQAWVKQESTKKFFLDVTTEGASQCRKNIDWNMLANSTIPVPSEREQSVLGSFITMLDNAITLHQRNYEQHFYNQIWFI